MDLDKLATARKRIRSSAVVEVGGFAWARNLALVYVGVVFPLLLAFLTANYSGFAAALGYGYYAVVAVIAGIAIVLVAIQILVPQSAAQLYFESLTIDEENAELRRALAGYTRLATVGQLTSSTALSWLIGLGEYSLKRPISPPGLREAVSEVVDAIVDNRDELFGVEENRELWNFAVYLWCPRKMRLFQLYRVKSPNHPAGPIGRSFAMGQGHVGKAFSDRSAKITADSGQPDVRNLMDAAPDLTRPYDAQLYVSYASIPIGDSENDGKPLGVLVATSNRVGRFDTLNAVPLRLCAQVIATLMKVTEFKFDSEMLTSQVSDEPREGEGP